MIRLRVRAAALVAAGLLCAAATGGGAVVDRTLRDPRIAEASGLAVSLRHPGVLWTHNDSGNPADLYALRPDGKVGARVHVRGVADDDWEAIAEYRDTAGNPTLAVADTGDNRARRSTVQIVLLPEPALHDATVTPSRVLRLRYPEGPVDAEALLVDAEAGRMYVVTKGLGGIVYRVPQDVWPGRPGVAPHDSGTFERIATVPLILVTDGVMGPGHHPVLRTYGELAVLPPITDDVVGGTLQPLAVAGLPDQKQGEGLTLTADGEVLLGSEGRDQPILRLPMPPDLASALGGSSTSGTASGSEPTPGSGTASGSRAPSGGTRAAGRPGSGGLLGLFGGVQGLLVLGGAVVAAAVIGTLVGRGRRT